MQYGLSERRFIQANGYNEKVTCQKHKDNELVCRLINSRTEKRIRQFDTATLKKALNACYNQIKCIHL